MYNNGQTDSAGPAFATWNSGPAVKTGTLATPPYVLTMQASAERAPRPTTWRCTHLVSPSLQICDFLLISSHSSTLLPMQHAPPSTPPLYPQDDGNLVVYDAIGRATWSTKTNTPRESWLNKGLPGFGNKD